MPKLPPATLTTAAPQLVDPRSPWPRLLSRELSATYLSCSVKEIDRLIAVQAISVVRLPAKRHENGHGVNGRNRRILIDRLELDRLCDLHREK